MEKLPLSLRDLAPADAIVAFNRAIIEATADLVVAYKPNLAFYEALGMRAVAIVYQDDLDDRPTRSPSRSQ